MTTIFRPIALAWMCSRSFTGLITANDIHGATTGVRYAAAAPLVGNRIYRNGTGVVSTVAGTLDGLGFALPGDPNEIFGNTTGVSLNGQMQNQYVHDNGAGVTGSGILGGNDLELANRDRVQHGGRAEFRRHYPV